MRAFLSHSSLDKGTVEVVSDQLRPGRFELDSRTFDAGLLNSQVIIDSLKRSDLFVLFLSERSSASRYVDFEVMLGVDFIAKGYLQRFLVICLDEKAFSSASENVRMFSVVRKVRDPDATARLIQAFLISAHESRRQSLTPFVGRRDAISDLESQVSSHERPPIRALLLSGNPGSGRKTLARNFYREQFPEVNSNLAQIDLNEFAGPEEVYRRLIATLRPSLPIKQLTVMFNSFAIADSGERFGIIAGMLNSLLSSREAVMLVGAESLQKPDGSLQDDILSIIERLEAKPHPPIVLISPRMVPRRFRQPEIAYTRLVSFDRASSTNLISRMLKNLSLSVNRSQLEELVSLADGHPYNIVEMIEAIKDIGVVLFLADTRGFREWKHRQTSEYVERIEFDDLENKIISILKIVPELDLSTVILATRMEANDTSDAMSNLINRHLIEARSERFLSRQRYAAR